MCYFSLFIARFFWRYSKWSLVLSTVCVLDSLRFLRCTSWEFCNIHKNSQLKRNYSNLFFLQWLWKKTILFYVYKLKSQSFLYFHPFPLLSCSNTPLKSSQHSIIFVSGANLTLLWLNYISAACCRIMWGWDEK